MKIIQSKPTTLSSMEYLEAAPGGRSTRRRKLDFELMHVDSLPDGLDALVVTSDLQAREIVSDGRCGRLLGAAVADQLSMLANTGVIPPAERIGVLLCGDLYTVPNADRRGGLGDVSEVWGAFSARFAWAAGVLGNHDRFENGAELPANIESAYLLDGNTVTLDGLTIGGVSGIVGMLNRPNRKDNDMFISLLDRVISLDSNIVLLHESPSCFGARRGNKAIRAFLELVGEVYEERAPLVFCGHTYWEEPLVTLPGGVQVLNVDHRVLVLRCPS